MESEQRIQALEQEVQILKTQIQSILLDIQTHLLTNAYPALRGHHTAGSSTEDDEDDDEYDRAAPVAKVRKVSSHAASPKHEKAAPPVHQSETILASLDEQQEWVLNNIQNLGISRTRDLIQANAEKRRFTPEVSDTLMRFTDMYAAAADTPTIPSRPAGMPTVKAVTTAPQQPVKTRAPQTPAAASIPAPQVVKPAQKITTTKAKPAAPAAPAVIQQPDQLIETPTTQENEDPEGSSLVLRLIAGVQNAGAGVRWGKNKS
ncbi:MAG: hypothetical protein GC179_16850 [Anaerolineaceae bacterium]|nr:hypothetical protein [Anaerolineaceae bacterium]